MRRGRPTGPTQQPAAKPSSSPMRGTTSDPFAALDSQDVQTRRAAADELAARFPSLDEFSLLHDRGQKFEFAQSSTGSDPINKRVTEALADDAFALPPATADAAPATKPSPIPTSSSISRTASFKKPKPYQDDAPGSYQTDSPKLYQAHISKKPSMTLQQSASGRGGMISTGVQTSPSSSPSLSAQQYPDVNKRPIWKVPLSSSHHNRTMSEKSPVSPLLKPELTLPPRPSLDSRSRSQMSILSIPKSTSSSRPSLESQRPAMDIGHTIDRARSANSNTRPASMHVESNLDYLRDREMASGRNLDAPSLLRRTTSTAIDDSDDGEARNIRSSVDFLRQIERDDSGQKHRRSSSQSKHNRLGSLSSLTSNTKNIVKGRFGDAFRRFETNNKTPEHERAEPAMMPSEQYVEPRRNHRDLTPIAGSEVTGRLSDDDDRDALDETEDVPPEVRRELERRRLSEEERRVEAAAAEYKRRVAEQGPGKPRTTSSKASTIQNRVKNLLDESNKPPPVNRTAEGYGKYTGNAKPLPTRPQDQSGMRQAPVVARKPISMGASQPGQAQDLAYAKPSGRPNLPPPIPSASAPPTTSARAPSGPPPRAPKPKALRTGGSTNAMPGSTSPSRPTASSRDKPLPRVGGGEGAGDEWDMDTFSKRYPSLSGLEMVETEIPRRNVRDV
jgi:AP2-associated kinase